MKNIKSTRAKADELPICPHCEKEINEIKKKELDKEKFTLVTRSFAYFCPHCRKLLAVGAGI